MSRGNSLAPDPVGWALVIIGIGAIGAAARRRRGAPASA
jgi:hypothetical protein